MARGFLISDGLRQDIKRTIARVDGMPDGPGATKIPTRFETIPTRGGGGGDINLATYSTGGDVWEKGFFGVVHDQRLEDNGALTPLYNDNGTPKTQSVLNLFSTLPPNYDAVRVCAYTKIRNVNVLIAAEC